MYPRSMKPSLTISAVSERAAEQLVLRAADLGLPAAPAGFRPGNPAVHVGERVPVAEWPVFVDGEVSWAHKFSGPSGGVT